MTGNDFAGLEDEVAALFAAYPADGGEAPPIVAETGYELQLDDVWLAALTAHEPDFAGRYHLSSTGCGTGCQAYFIANPSDPQHRAGFTASLGADYRTDSRLVIVNPPAELAAYGENELPAYLRPSCMVLQEDESFAEVDCGFTPGE